MYQRLRRFVFFGMLVIALDRLASADVVFQIDMDTILDGVQNTRSVSAGTVFDVGLIMQITGTNTVGGFSVGMNFDASEASISNVDTSGRPSGFANVNPIVINNTTGTVRPFDGISFGPALTNSFPGLIGKFQVTAFAPITDGFADFTPAFQINGIDGVSDGVTFLNLPIGVNGGVFFQSGALNITAVPEPSSLFASLIAMSACWVYRLRRRSSSVKSSVASTCD